MATAAPLTPDAALTLLRDVSHYYWLTRPDYAVEHLQRMLGRTELVQLYKRCFPKDFRESQKSLRSKSPGAHSPREMEFFDLVRERRFPIDDIWSGEDEDNRMDYIPIQTYALDDEAIENWRLAWQVIYGLCQELVDEVDWNAIMDELPPGTPLPRFVQDRAVFHFDAKRFFRRVHRAGPRLRHIRRVFEMATYSTGNVFLDTTFEMLGNSELPGWDKENIDWLTKQWRRAEPKLERIEAVIDWLEADPQRVADLIRHFNACLTKEENEP